MSAAPQLRGLLASHTKKHMYICIGVTFAVVASVKHFFVDANVKKREEYYKYVKTPVLCVMSHTVHVLNR